ncbi:helix-turn-helix transcriptional regulator [Phenylobacterium sp. J426]|nr:helix-turn-helix transcriptional regulator [Phenylobacterium sp. J426]
MRLLTQHELARLASTSPTMISRLESGVARPSPELLVRLAAALELPETEWLQHDPNASRPGSSE